MAVVSDTKNQDPFVLAMRKAGKGKRTEKYVNLISVCEQILEMLKEQNEAESKPDPVIKEELRIFTEKWTEKFRLEFQNVESTEIRIKSIMRIAKYNNAIVIVKAKSGKRRNEDALWIF